MSIGGGLVRVLPQKDTLVSKVSQPDPVVQLRRQEWEQGGLREEYEYTQYLQQQSFNKSTANKYLLIVIVDLYGVASFINAVLERRKEGDF